MTVDSFSRLCVKICETVGEKKFRPEPGTYPYNVIDIFHREKKAFPTGTKHDHRPTKLLPKKTTTVKMTPSQHPLPNVTGTHHDLDHRPTKLEPMKLQSTMGRPKKKKLLLKRTTMVKTREQKTIVKRTPNNQRTLPNAHVAAQPVAITK